MGPISAGVAVVEGGSPAGKTLLGWILSCGGVVSSVCTSQQRRPEPRCRKQASKKDFAEPSTLLLFYAQQAMRLEVCFEAGTLLEIPEPNRSENKVDQVNNVK